MTDTTNSAEITSSTEPLAVVPSDTVIPTTDQKTIRLVIWGLVAYLISVLVADVAVFLVAGAHLPDEILTTGGVALGALGSMLARTSS